MRALGVCPAGTPRARTAGSARCGAVSVHPGCGDLVHFRRYSLCTGPSARALGRLLAEIQNKSARRGRPGEANLDAQPDFHVRIWLEISREFWPLARWCAPVRHCGTRRVRVHADAALSRGRRCESLSARTHLRLFSLVTLEFVARFNPAADNRQRTSACDISAYPGRGNTFEFFHPGARRPPTGAGAVL